MGVVWAKLIRSFLVGRLVGLSLRPPAAFLGFTVSRGFSFKRFSMAHFSFGRLVAFSRFSTPAAFILDSWYGGGLIHHRPPFLAARGFSKIRFPAGRFFFFKLLKQWRLFRCWFLSAAAEVLALPCRSPLFRIHSGVVGGVCAFLVGTFFGKSLVLPIDWNSINEVCYRLLLHIWWQGLRKPGVDDSVRPHHATFLKSDRMTKDRSHVKNTQAKSSGIHPSILQRSSRRILLRLPSRVNPSTM